MKPPRIKWTRLLVIAGAILLAGQSVFADVLDKTKTIDGTTVQYKVVLPHGYDPAKAYPAVLAFAGGPQTMDLVERTLERHWRAEAERRGYIVVIPAAPRGRLFFLAGARIFPQFIIELLQDYKITNSKFHIAGVSNGGISAFHIAASFPQYFLSVTGFPGYLPDPSPTRVRALSNLCINMYVGEQDTQWVEAIQRQADDFIGQGFTVTFSEELGQRHRIETLEGEGAARFFKLFEAVRLGRTK